MCGQNHIVDVIISIILVTIFKSLLLRIYAVSFSETFTGCLNGKAIKQRKDNKF